MHTACDMHCVEVNISATMLSQRNSRVCSDAYNSPNTQEQVVSMYGRGCDHRGMAKLCDWGCRDLWRWNWKIPESKASSRHSLADGQADGLFRRDFDWCIDSSNINAAFQTPQLHRRNQGLILNGSQNAIISFQHVVVYHAWQIFALLHCFLLSLIKGNLIFSKSEGTFVPTKQRFSFASCKLQVIFKGF